MRPDDPQLTPDEARARDAVRALSGVEASPDFRERLKADFVAGRLSESSPAVAPTASVSPEPAPERAADTGAKVIPMRLWVSLAAAAVAVLALFFGGREPGVEFAGVVGEGTVIVDGRSYDAADTAGLADAVRPGARVEVPEGVSLAASVSGKFVVEFEHATGIVPEAPRRWFGGTPRAVLALGEIRLLTGAGFRGGLVEIETPDGMVRVTGTLVSAVRDEGGTCVCVRHGTATVGRDEADLRPVPPGKRLVLYADRREPLLTEIAPPHVEHLLDFEARLRDVVHP